MKPLAIILAALSLSACTDSGTDPFTIVEAVVSGTTPAAYAEPATVVAFVEPVETKPKEPECVPVHRKVVCP